MTVQVNLNERHQRILQATVKHYIATAEPVGSKTLIQEYDFSVSSATVRNVMGKLEKAGFLYQPYTSAGRIPSDSGYRIYVDRLLPSQKPLKKSLAQSLNSKVGSVQKNYEILFKKITQVLSDLSGCIALVTLPQTTSNIIYHLQLLRIAEQKIMLVMVIDNYQTESVLFDHHDFNLDHDSHIGEVIDQQLQMLSNFLNHKLKGRSLFDIDDLDWSELEQGFKQYAHFINHLLEKITENYRISSHSPIMVQGIAKMVRQPEFAQIEHLQILLQLLEEEQEQLFPVVFNLDEPQKSFSKVKITIGSENPLQSMHYCSLISSNYYQGTYPVGSVGIIGPTRIAYEDAITLVESTADYLSQNLSNVMDN
ncbi:heat-inducible transcriptional repressor HrcA [Cyanobacterium sp. HL-69]|uniref:heat-inducible transcriptional repressor HrcA n=1 Tax=Cyanobacterium sp. HL-69 TaxID=2054282 RepID=UPI000CA1D5F6|nr:heat-inducible transcriptional repressor HrcA [Cyanobacterium sp. HL-69]